MVFLANRLECEKSMLRTASDQRSVAFRRAVQVGLWQPCLNRDSQVNSRTFDRDFYTLHTNTVSGLFFHPGDESFRCSAY